MTRHLNFSLIALALCWSATATDFYVDPAQGRPGNPGTADAPWPSLDHALEQIATQAWPALPYKEGARLEAKNPSGVVKGGDTIFLRDGSYGDLRMTNRYNTAPIALAAAEGHTPKFHSIRLRSGSNWIFRGLHLSPEYGDGDHPRSLLIVESNDWSGPVHDVTIEDCVLRSTDDSSGWSVEDWNQKSSSGIGVGGARMVIRGNELKNVNHGIMVDASDALVEHNSIVNFAGDGLRGLGDRSVFQYNLVKNCYNVNGNHDDAFQSYSRSEAGVGKGVVTDIVLRGNTFINYEDPDQPHRGTLQGIGCFDGTFVDWVIENNVIIVDHYHGITLLGARGCRIVNNTVVEQRPGRPGPPSIRIGKHKNGQAPSDCLLRNNIAHNTSYDAGEGMQADHNVKIADPQALFEHYDTATARFDLRLKAGSPAIGAGTAESMPEVDISGAARSGEAVNAGAYQR